MLFPLVSDGLTCVLFDIGPNVESNDCVLYGQSTDNEDCALDCVEECVLECSCDDKDCVWKSLITKKLNQILAIISRKCFVIIYIRKGVILNGYCNQFGVGSYTDYAVTQLSRLDKNSRLRYCQQTIGFLNRKYLQGEHFGRQRFLVDLASQQIIDQTFSRSVCNTNFLIPSPSEFNFSQFHR